MNQSTKTLQVQEGFAELKQLGEKCLTHVKELYPATWQASLEDNFCPQIDLIADAMKEDKAVATMRLYNGTKLTHEKIFFAAAYAYQLCK